MKQEIISKILNIHQSEVSRIFTGKRPVSWPIAARLHELFSDLYPDKSVIDWKENTSPEDLRHAFAVFFKVKTDMENASIGMPTFKQGEAV
ncbi:MAG: helix-turn-helix transcriptional regulator [Desulfotignum sp.]|nr:helix-turn-helix transcriptional regulator [Desulfotignum sp.]MCF8126863.1 helix-turn-helix transcriptional regulator [Desulfotignum sp.]